jgi:hypothetical protein
MEKLRRGARWDRITILNKPTYRAKKPRYNQRRRRCRLQQVCAIRLPETGHKSGGWAARIGRSLTVKNLDN